MNRYITTITIVHEAESVNSAKQDAEYIRRQLTYRCAEMHVAQEIGAVRNVTLFSVREKK